MQILGNGPGLYHPRIDANVYEFLPEGDEGQVSLVDWDGHRLFSCRPPIIDSMQETQRMHSCYQRSKHDDFIMLWHNCYSLAVGQEETFTQQLYFLLQG